MRQEEIAQSLGTSRIPVREALLQLESEGLITLVPNSGAWVARLDASKYSEIYQLREAVEPFAIAQSAPLMTDKLLERLRILAAEIEKSSDDLLRWLALDRRFYLESYSAAPMPRVLALVEGYLEPNAAVPAPPPLRAGGRPPPARAHGLQLILDALERRDAEDAEAHQRCTSGAPGSCSPPPRGLRFTGRIRRRRGSRPPVVAPGIQSSLEETPWSIKPSRGSIKRCPKR